MAAIDDILAFDWPQNKNNQGGAMRQFLGFLDDLQSEWDGLLHPVLQINQAAPPSVADWEALWVNEGNVLPIPDGATLLWWSTAEGEFGGMYTAANGEVVRAENRFYPGRLDTPPFVIPDLTVDLTTSATLQSTSAAQTFTITRPAKLLMSIISGIATCKLSYKLNGTYQIINGSLTNEGVMGSNDYSQWTFLHPSTLTPGTYTIDFYVVSFGAGGKIVHANRRLDLSASPPYTGYIPPIILWELIYQ